MRKLKIMQCGLFLTVVIATALLVCVSLDIASALYMVLFCIFVLAPQVVAIIFQLRIRVQFHVGEKMFLYPDAFVNGHLSV